MPIFYRFERSFPKKAILAVLAVPLLSITVAAAPVETRLPFTVSRNGTKIGSHVISIIRDGDTTVVTISSLFVVKVAFVTLYRFEHDSTEVWNKGKLWSLQAKSNDNGTHYRFTGHAQNGAFIIDGFRDKHAIHEELPDMASAGLWGAEMAHGAELLNTLTGLPVTVQIKDLGEESLIVRGVPIKAHHVQITGQLVQDDWYDKNGSLVRKVAKGPDGSDVDFELS